MARTYRLVALGKNDSEFNDNIIIQDDLGNSWSRIGTVEGKDDGPVFVDVTSASSATSFELLIDYRQILLDGMPVASSYATNKFAFSPNIFSFTPIDRLSNEVSAIEGAISSIDGHLPFLAAWRSPEADVIISAGQLSVARAIRSVRITGGSRDRQYRIVTLAKNHASFNDNLIIRDDLGNQWIRTGTIPDKDSGPVSVTVGSLFPTHVGMNRPRFV